MNSKQIIIGNYYRLKSSPDYGYAKVLQLFRPRQYSKEYNCYIVKCEHTVSKNDSVGFIRYFKLDELVHETSLS